MVAINTPQAIAETITPPTLAPIATGKTIANGSSSSAACWAILAVVGTQDTPAIPTTGLKSPFLNQ